MPLDTSQTFGHNNHPLVSADELRLALIGNNDLKESLLKDASFTVWLRDALNQETRKLSSQQEPGSRFKDNRVSDKVPADSLEELPKLLVVLRLLADHVLDASKPVPIPGLYAALGGSITALLDIVAYVRDTYSPCPFSSILSDIFDIFIILGNTSTFFIAYMDFEKLWRFLCSLSFSQSDKSIATSALKLVPFLLDQMTEASPFEIQSANLLSAHLLDELKASFQNVSDEFSSVTRGFHHHDMSYIQSMMVAVAQLLNFVKGIESDKSNSAMNNFFEDSRTLECMMSLLYIEDAHVLNLATLNLFQLQLLTSSEIENEEGSTHETFQKLYPRIIELLQHDASDIPKYLNFAISVLSDLCLKYSGVCVHLRNTNTDHKIMRDLLQLFEDSAVFLTLHQIKLSLKDGKRIADFTILKNSADEVTSDSFKELDVIANFFLLLSVYTSANEDFRRRITSFAASKSQKNSPNFICLMIFDITETYKFLINQILLNYEMLRKMRHQDFGWIANNISVLITLLEHPLFTNTLYLMRSLSRSVSTLRTFFVDCNSIRGSFDVDEEKEEDLQLSKSIVGIVEARYDREVTFDRTGNLVFSMLDILGKLEVTGHVLGYLTSASDRSRQHKTRKEFYVKKVIALASLANFILDFSSFRYEIVKRVEFLNDLASLFQNSLHTKDRWGLKTLSSRESREVAFEQSRIQLAVLQVIKNYLYNENEENRKVIWTYIPLALIIEKASYGVSTPIEQFRELHLQQLQHKVICFEILRNLTAASTHFSESIVGAYESFVQQMQNSSIEYEVPETWDQFLVKNLMSFNLFEDIGETEFVEQFFEDDRYALQLIKNPEYVKLVVAINYIEDHRYTNITEFSGMDFPSRRMLRIWKRFLELRISPQNEARLCASVSEQVHLSNQLSEIKLSISWILINLTWRDGEFDFQSDKSSFSLVDTISSSNSVTTSLNMLIDPEISPDEMSDEILGPEARARLLYRHGFADVLQRLVQDMSMPRTTGAEKKIDRFDHLNSNDVYEKAKAAHYQIISLVAKVGETDRTAGLANHPLRRSSNIINIRESHEIRHHLRNSITGSSATDTAADASLTPAEEEDDDENESEEEIDEYWIR